MISETLEYVSQGLDMTEHHAHQTMLDIMDGKWTPSQIAGLLMALKVKGETVNEISGFVNAMRAKALKVDAPDDVVDIVGTGGDGLFTINISTAAAVVAAAAGVPVAKHGNRSVSSMTGSADVFAELGVNINMSPNQALDCLNKVGIVFLFAPLYHASMKHAVVPRKEMGVRTVFNILGPMSNPAGVRRQLIGTFNIDVAEKMVRVLKQTGSEHVLVVHSADGMDEISLSSETQIYELKDGEIKSYKISPEQFGLQCIDIDDIKGGEAVENAEILNRIFDGQNGPASNAIALNAGAAIYVGGVVETIEEGFAKAKEVIASGKVRDKLNELVDYTNSVGS